MYRLWKLALDMNGTCQSAEARRQAGRINRHLWPQIHCIWPAGHSSRVDFKSRSSIEPPGFKRLPIDPRVPAPMLGQAAA